MKTKTTLTINTELAAILDTMGIALIEIRACEDLQTCHALASVFHNVPAGIRIGIPSEKILEGIFAEAKRWEVERFIKNQYALSLSKFTHSNED